MEDPNAPKRGLSAYMFFANEQRENVRDENPGISFGMARKALFLLQLEPANAPPSQAKSARFSARDGRH